MYDDRDVVLGDDDGDENRARVRRARRGAGLYDVLVLAWAIGILAVPLREVAPVLADGSLFLLWLLLVLVEGLTGASPGKHVTGMQVVRRDGRPVSLLTAVRRRPWGWLLPLQFVGPVPNAIATAVALGTLLVMAVTTERAADGRGFQDRLAGTEVVAGAFNRQARLVVVVLTVLAAVAGLVLAAQLTPVTPA